MSEQNRKLRVCFVGAGAVNFGGAEGPWNHSQRLEQLGGVDIVAIVDLDTGKAESVLEKKKKGSHSSLYSDCIVYSDCTTALRECKFDVAFIGIPPYCHGASASPLELELLEAGIDLFIEKPVSVVPPEQFNEYSAKVVHLQQQQRRILSVGYMFRYHPAVTKLCEIIAGRNVMMMSARYNCAYSELDHPFWWNISKSGGPIVEQATHFCDLVRYIAGEVEQSTVKGCNIPPSEQPGEAGYLNAVPLVVQEAKIPLDRQIPRATACCWQFKKGGVGTLMHGVTLHGKRYEATIEVWCDGLRVLLENIYFPECKLRVRESGSDEDAAVYPFRDADPYLEEVKAFLDAVRNRDTSLVRSSYEDATKTYQFSWDLRRAAEASN